MFDDDFQGTEREFDSLSIKDLLTARDFYHFHLMNKPNVVGTAIGRYLIRKADPWPSARRDAKSTSLDAEASPLPRSERTFDNSEVRDYSWPCIHVLVTKWVERTAFDDRTLPPDALVPPTLYLPDGRSVPVCVIKVEPTGPASIPTAMPRYRGRLAPGMPVFLDVQGQRRVASIGCLVTDGHKVYALTNRHVTGTPGMAVSAWWRGQLTKIGTATDRGLSRRPFSEVYEDYPGRRSFLNLDIGLIEIDDVSRWSTSVRNLGDVGPIVDLHEANLRLALLEGQVTASGGVSGVITGRIKALFYRYRSVGGFDYVADLLIAPDVAAQQTRPGDSGSVWHLTPRDRSKSPRPLAVEWGGESWANSPGQPKAFALATMLSNVCRMLDVEVICADPRGARRYWGDLGHYAIATYAVDLLAAGNLRTLFDANVDRISFVGEELDKKTVKEMTAAARESDEFVPLADVPDIVWKTTAYKMIGGRDPVPRRGPEHPTHYADIDEPDEHGDTLLSLCLANPATNLDPAVWLAFYHKQNHKDRLKQGLLPFRVWQFFDEMVDAVRNQDVDRYIAAAGILSHYVGDACQPLHGSRYADGYTDPARGKEVHSAYESGMILRKDAELRELLDAKLDGVSILDAQIDRGRDAALEIVRLMDRSATRLPPTELIDTYIEAGEKNVVAVQDALWDAFGDVTADLMLDGASVLAALWTAAWRIGAGDTVRANDLVPREIEKLMALYQDEQFVPSLALDQIGARLKP